MDFTNDIINLTARVNAIEAILISSLPAIIDVDKLDQWASETKANTAAAGMDPRVAAAAAAQIDEWVAAVKKRKS